MPYVDVETLLKAVIDNAMTRFDWSEAMDVEDFEKALASIPAVDVIEVRHGEWEILLTAIIDTIGKCTNCGGEAVWRTRLGPYTICPHCGAKMDGGFSK